MMLAMTASTRAAHSRHGTDAARSKDPACTARLALTPDETEAEAAKANNVPAGDDRILCFGIDFIVYMNGNRYEGEVKDGQKNGRGTIVYAEGDRYTGEFKDDKEHGRGVSVNANGDRYEGEYKRGRKHGRGVYVFAGGASYDGEYKYDRKHGRGVYTYADGDTYDGEYKDGKRHGRGVHTYPRGSKYEGEFEDDRISGRGVFVNADGAERKGVFSAGTLMREEEPASRSDPELPEEFTCPICMCVMDNPHQCKQGHNLCLHCWERCLSGGMGGGRQVCPIDNHTCVRREDLVPNRALRAMIERAGARGACC